MFCLITGNAFAVSNKHNDFFRIYFQFLLKPFVVFRRFQRVIFNPGHPWIKFPRTPSSRRPFFHRTRHSLIAVREKREKTVKGGREGWTRRWEFDPLRKIGALLGGNSWHNKESPAFHRARGLLHSLARLKGKKTKKSRRRRQRRKKEGESRRKGRARRNIHYPLAR